MKKIILFIVLCFTLNLNIQAEEYFKGDPEENKIIGSGDMYVVIHNPSKLALTVMSVGAEEYCRDKLKNNDVSVFMQILGNYTAYFSCIINNKVDQYDLSVQEKSCIESMVYGATNTNCIEKNKNNVDIINLIEVQKSNENKFQTLDFVFFVRAELFEEQLRLSKKFDVEQKLVIKIINYNKEICRKYGFEVGSDWYNKCLLSVISNSALAYSAGHTLTFQLP